MDPKHRNRAQNRPNHRRTSPFDKADYEFLHSNAQIAQSLNVEHFPILSQPIVNWSYIRIANEIAQKIQPCDLLDWGCGYGQMTFLLNRRGFRVTSFDLGSLESELPNIPLCRNLSVVRTMHSTRLPFDDSSFDAVLSCGVLEHVDEGSQSGNEIKSLREIARVLRPGGVLLVFQLPQRYAWKEALIRRFKLGYAHARRYSKPEIVSLLSQTGFSVKTVGRANLIPKNLTGMPASLRRHYSQFTSLLMALDDILCQVPVLNQFAGVMEITAQKRD